MEILISFVQGKNQLIPSIKIIDAAAQKPELGPDMKTFTNGLLRAVEEKVKGSEPSCLCPGCLNKGKEPDANNCKCLDCGMAEQQGSIKTCKERPLCNIPWPSDWKCACSECKNLQLGSIWTYTECMCHGCPRNCKGIGSTRCRRGWEHFGAKPALHINLNTLAKVTLTPEGQKILRATPGAGSSDMTGCYKAQLWEIMRIFGPHLLCGCRIPFENNLIEIEEQRQSP